MCGLAAIHLAPQERTTAQWQRIQTLFTENLLANEERGLEASGMALISARGFWFIFKWAVCASQFIKSPEYKNIWKYVNADTTCLLGHTRRPTKGAPVNDANNHPIQTGQIIGVHNGQIKNDDELFANNKFKRIGDVDSEIIFQMLNEINPQKISSDGYIAQLKQQIALFQGDYTFLFVDLRLPTRLFVIKKNQPLSLHWDPELQALFFSSRYIFLRKNFGNSVIHTSLPYNNGYGFDCRRLPSHKSTPVYSFPINKTETSKN
jgi:glucosamine 6-phosphate synthetase-like amidotransferase/phosphosugar isomerase protein